MTENNIESINSLTDLHRVISGYKSARIIQTASIFRIFDYLETPVPSETIAEKAGLSHRGCELLLNALCSLNLVQKLNDTYTNTPLASRHLLSNSESRFLDAAAHSEKTFRRWTFLPESIRDGLPKRNETSKLLWEPSDTLPFIRGMHAHSRKRASEIVPMLDWKGCRRILDIAGGSGIYLIEIIKSHPEVRGVLIDRKNTLIQAKRIIREENAMDKIQMAACDIFDGELPFNTNVFDRVILSNILHIEGPEKNSALLKQIRRVLKPAGKLVIIDFILNNDGTSPQEGAIFSLNMLTATERGRSWRCSDISSWLQAAGFGIIHDFGTRSGVQIWLVDTHEEIQVSTSKHLHYNRARKDG
ncbi:methyltransferase domain-containing protein [bacterium]|nr:methyltransferase domain-containing protein [candidate division CSSED10-310 bacterium]